MTRKMKAAMCHAFSQPLGIEALPEIASSRESGAPGRYSAHIERGDNE